MCFCKFIWTGHIFDKERILHHRHTDELIDWNPNKIKGTLFSVLLWEISQALGKLCLMTSTVKACNQFSVHSTSHRSGPIKKNYLFSSFDSFSVWLGCQPWTKSEKCHLLNFYMAWLFWLNVQKPAVLYSIFANMNAKRVCSVTREGVVPRQRATWSSQKKQNRAKTVFSSMFCKEILYSSN